MHALYWLPIGGAVLLDALCSQQVSSIVVGPAKAVLAGRCVDPATGAGLARCEVTLTGQLATGYPIAWGIPEWIDPLPVTTDETGRFEFVLAAPLTWDADAGWPPRCHLQVRHPRRVGWSGQFEIDAFVRAGGGDCGDLPMDEGQRPVIRVVHADGSPAVGVTVDVGYSGLADAAERPFRLARLRVHRLVSDASGTLPLAMPLRLGDWSLKVPNRTVVGGSRQFELVDGQRAPHLQIVVEVMPTRVQIRGRVRDAAGTPIGGDLIGVGDDGEEPQLVRTAEDGTFVQQRPSPSPSRVTLTWAGLSRFDRAFAVPVDKLPWGSDDVTIEVPVRRVVTFEVVGPSGAPVRACSVHVVPRQPAIGMAPWRAAKRAEDGRIEGRLADGTWEVLVVAEDAALEVSGWLPLVVGADTAVQRLALPARTVRTIRVVESKGAAVAGALVRVFAAPRQHPGVRPVTPGGALCGRDPVAADVLIAFGTTDVAGQVRLPGPPGGAALEVSGAGLVDSSLACPWAATDLRLKVTRR